MPAPQKVSLTSILWVVISLTFPCPHRCAVAQAGGVPVYNESRGAPEHSQLTNAVQQIRESGQAIGPATVREQLRRGSCRLDLPAPNSEILTPRGVWEHARRSYLRVGWYYQCENCDQWRLNLAGGYVLTADGAVATSYHVVEPPRDAREGCLLAADELGNVFPVVEVLAANRFSDACIVRIKDEHFKPLPLNTNITPGDTVYCLSEPFGRRGFFSKGIVNRFFQLEARRLPYQPGAPLFAPVRIEVSCECGPGSSGAAVLDDCGNAIGHVSTVSASAEAAPPDAKAVEEPFSAAMVFHQAASARDVRALVRKAK